MTDALRIIERGPWEETRERYRQLAAEDRPGNPLDLPQRKALSPMDRDCLIAVALVAVVAPLSALILSVIQ